MLGTLLKPRVVMVIMLSYMALSFTLPIRREIFEWGSGPEHPYNALFHAHIWVPLLIVLWLMVFDTAKSWRTYNWLQSLTSPKVILSLAYVMIAACMVLTLAKIPGLWWTWLTLVYNKLRKGLPNSVSLIIAGGLICLAIFIWECCYQTVFYYKYYQEILESDHLTNQFLFLGPLLMAGLLSLGYYAVALDKAFKSDRRVLIPIGLFVGAWMVWIAMGFWVDILYDFDTEHWVQTDPDNLQMMVYRSSKVSLNLIPIVLFRGGT